MASLTYAKYDLQSGAIRATKSHVSSSSRLAKHLHIGIAAAASCATEESKPQCASAFHICLIFAIIPLAKASHKVKLRGSVRKDCLGTWVQRSHEQTGGHYYNNLPQVFGPR